MKHLTAIIIKFFMVTIFLEILLILMTDLTFVQVLSISLILTVLSYLLGDLLVLSLANNTVATIADTWISFVVIYLYKLFASYGSIGIVDAIITALVLGIGEWFYHMYVSRSVFGNHETEEEK